MGASKIFKSASRDAPKMLTSKMSVDIAAALERFLFWDPLVPIAAALERFLLRDHLVQYLKKIA